MKKNIFFAIIIIFSLTGLAWAQERPNLTCDLEKDVPLGQVVNQTEYTSGKILKAAREATEATSRAIKAAKRTIELTDSCQTSNCQSNCQTQDIPTACPGTPTTTCTAGYACTLKHSQAVLGDSSHPAVPAFDCENLEEMINVEPQRSYGIFEWTGCQAACDLNNPGCPAGVACETPGTERLGSEICADGCSGISCRTMLNSIRIKPNQSYAAFRWTQDYVNWLTCYNSCTNNGDCAAEFGECLRSSCQNQGCAGQACNFAEIGQKSAVVNQAAQTTKNSYEKINKIIHDKVANLPLLGNVCKIPGLGILCQVSSYKTELETILSLQKKSIINTRSCWNDPKDYEKILSGEKSGKFLFRCQEISPYYLEKCYPDNFYCCY